jgi:hypothetical protein
MTLSKRIRALFEREPVQRFDQGPPVRFSAGPMPVDQLVAHMYAKRLGGLVSREQALSLPVVLRGRNLICDVATLPLVNLDEQNRLVPRPLFEQIDPNVPNVVTLSMTIEDLLFESIAWWRIVGYDDEGMPSRCVRYSPDQVSFRPPIGFRSAFLPSGEPTEIGADGARGEPRVTMGGESVPASQVIRFDSPNRPLLEAGRRAIARALALDEAADLYASNPQARGYFTPKDGVDPGDPQKIIDALDEWAVARRDRVDGYVPAALEYQVIQNPTPTELQITAPAVR